ncbi:MAG: RrF2 family transcriptional regulator [Ruminococcaceae bacterium]|nr:RrF2 family transcriptional regulator [Oscillospiraceae bacterium]
MMISTKGRYALRVMIDLAEEQAAGYTPLKGIVEREDVSQKYLESIMTMLSKAGLVDAVHGKGGGYRLNRPVEEYTLADILSVTEGSLAPVACLHADAEPCEKADECRTRPVWTKLEEIIEDYLRSVSLKDLSCR